MNFLDTKKWVEKERTCPLRENISTILASCNELTEKFPEEKLKTEIFKADAQQIIYTLLFLDDIPPMMSIVIGFCIALDPGIPEKLKDVYNFFYNVYHVRVEVIALFFNNTYKIMFKTDSVENFKTYIPTLSSELATAYPNATISTDESKRALFINNTIDL